MANEPLPLLRLGWTFLRIGALAFGGLGVTVALIEQDLVRRQKVISSERVAEALTYTKLLPGSTVVQVVAYVGWRLGGWTASTLATIAFLTPSVAMMLLLAYGYSVVVALPAIATLRRGVLAAVVGLLLVTMHRLGKPILTRVLPILLALLAFTAGASGVSAVWIVIAAGIVGVVTKQGYR